MDDIKWQIAREIPHLRRYARALTRDPEDADDLVQDCLERALRKRHLWQRRGSLRGWLFRMLYHVHLNRRRGQSRRPVVLGTEAIIDGPATPPAQESHVECRRVADALDQLPAHQRDALLLVSLEGMPYDEAAWVLKVPVGTLRSRLSRARDALRASIAMRRPQTTWLRRVK